MSDLRREDERSITQQIVDLFEGAVESGELSPGEKLPPTRELAEIAGVNHLTAVRAYRRLRERGVVSAQVGSGTFVRDSAPVAGDVDGGAPDPGVEWQRYVLPELAETYADQVMKEMFRQSRARGLIPLSVGYPSEEIFPVPELRRATAAVLDDDGTRALQYTDIPGSPALIEQVAKLSAQRGAPEKEGEIVITTGARQGLTLAARATLRPGDLVACEAPTFFGVLESMRATGARLLPVPVDDDGLDVGTLEDLLGRQEIRLLVLQPRLHNPTGRDLSPARRSQLIELARRHGFFILEDGIYGEIRFEGEPRPSLRSESHSHVIYIDSLSKLIGGGLRVGWVAASGPILERILAEKRRDDMHSASLPQLAVAHFLDEGHYDQHLERARDFYRGRRDALLEGIDRHLGGLAAVVHPLGGGHVWLTLEDEFDESELSAEAVRHGVTFVPGGAMLPEPRAGTELRLSYGFLGPEALVEGVRRLARAIKSLSKRPREAAALPIA